MEAWGREVVRLVSLHFEGVESIVGTPFWAVPPESRAKATDSFVTKALYKPRKGRVGYEDPLREITDQVGARFVTLLQEDADKVVAYIESHEGWASQSDRNFRVAIHENPTVFDYFATHILVRTKTDIVIGGVEVPSGTCCEIQVRTLLQHAHSELMHNTTYKGQLGKNVDVVRKVARGAAMIEGTDEIFDTVAERILEATKPVEELSAGLKDLYEQHVKVPPSIGPLHRLMIYSLVEDLPPTDGLESVENHFEQHPNLFRVVEKRAPDTPYFKAPAVLLAIYLIERRQRHLRSKWPLTESELDQLIASVGYSPGL